MIKKIFLYLLSLIASTIVVVGLVWLANSGYFIYLCIILVIIIFSNALYDYFKGVLK
ncbi:hypothetical protein ACQW5G_00635 [Fructilactobacillus sp. Tb1]|uniref:hypothetical protein n=1 Tax=Fructilactobacillus sp. Tb1 TaxID=3422304 RepID=UPI003D280B97